MQPQLQFTKRTADETISIMERIKCWVGRRNAVGNEENKYQERSHGSFGGMALAPPSYRPPPLVTSSTFDKDDRFAAVAKAMLYRFENEGFTAREAIEVTLIANEERRAFLESLDLRNAQLYIDHPEEIEEFSLVAIVQMTAKTFGDELRAMWRESFLNEDGSAREEPTLVSDNYSKPPPSPRHIKTPRSDPDSSHSSKSSSGRRRRRFFADSDHLRCRTRIRFDFKVASAQHVQALQLDGFALPPPPLVGYQPPSPLENSTRLNTRH